MKNPFKKAKSSKTTKAVDKELEAVKAQVNELDSRVNCIYFDRFTKSVRNGAV